MEHYTSKAKKDASQPKATHRALSMLPLAIVLGLSVGCGKGERSNDSIPNQPFEAEAYTAEFDNFDQSIDDGILALDDAEDAELQEEAEAVAAESAPEVMPGQDSPIREKTLSRNCKDDPTTGKTTVTVQKERAHVGTPFSNKDKETVAAGQTVELVRVWSRNGASVGCDTESQRALVDRANLDGLKLEISFKRKSRAATPNLPDQDSAAKAGYLAEGTRTVHFSQETEDGKVLITKNIESSVMRKARLATKADSVGSKFEVKTIDGPIVYLVVRDAETLKTLSRTIVSGKTLTKKGNGASLITSFNQVKFESSDGCHRPVSGEVTADHVSKNEKARTIQIKFTDDSPSLTVLNGNKVVLEKKRSSKCGSEK